VIDLARKRVTLGGEELQLTPTELDLLTAFARNPEAMFSEEELSQLVWGEAMPTTVRTLGGAISAGCEPSCKLARARGRSFSG
jgi:DNA-binding response OmpR family regulator